VAPPLTLFLGYIAGDCQAQIIRESSNGMKGLVALQPVTAI